MLLELTVGMALWAGLRHWGRRRRRRLRRWLPAASAAPSMSGAAPGCRGASVVLRAAAACPADSVRQRRRAPTAARRTADGDGRFESRLPPGANALAASDALPNPGAEGPGCAVTALYRLDAGARRDRRARWMRRRSPAPSLRPDGRRDWHDAGRSRGHVPCVPVAQPGVAASQDNRRARRRQHREPDPPRRRAERQSLRRRGGGGALSIPAPGSGRRR